MSTPPAAPSRPKRAHHTHPGSAEFAALLLEQRPSQPVSLLDEPVEEKTPATKGHRLLVTSLLGTQAARVAVEHLHKLERNAHGALVDVVDSMSYTDWTKKHIDITLDEPSLIALDLEMGEKHGMNPYRFRLDFLGGHVNKRELALSRSFTKFAVLTRLPPYIMFNTSTTDPRLRTPDKPGQASETVVCVNPFSHSGLCAVHRASRVEVGRLPDGPHGLGGSLDQSNTLSGCAHASDPDVSSVATPPVVF